jgi:predicted DNA-binding transcriptional regulator AlpA
MSLDASFIGRRALLRQLGISKCTLLRWTKTRAFPEPLPGSGQTPIYDITEIDAWLRKSQEDVQ